MNTDLKARIIDLPRFLDERGNLSFVEQHNGIPFAIERVYWIYDVPGGEARGGHAYKTNHELIIALSGSFEVRVREHDKEQTFLLNRSYYGLYIPAGVWRRLENFSTNSLALIAASAPYSADDYIMDSENAERPD